MSRSAFRHIARRAILFALVAGSLAATGHAADKTLDEYRKTIKKRLPRLLELKEQGVVGETRDGKVAVVKNAEADENIKKLVKAENADRKGVYAIIAEKEGTSPEKVGRLNGERNFRKASKGAHLRAADGTWFRKQEAAGTLPARASEE